MTDKEFNLSREIRPKDRKNFPLDKAHLLLRWEGGLIPVQYVKEFIRLLKEKLKPITNYENSIISAIDTLAGEKLCQ